MLNLTELRKEINVAKRELKSYQNGDQSILEVNGGVKYYFRNLGEVAVVNRDGKLNTRVINTLDQLIRSAEFLDSLGVTVI